MRGKYADDNGFELLKLFPWDGVFLDIQFSGEQAAQRVTLVDGKRANNAAGIRDGFESLPLAWRQPHSNPPLQDVITIELKMLAQVALPSTALFHLR
jgi:hypothetical protein